MKNKKNNGITLIALVITIIVMLILVGVTVSMAVNGGLLGYAGKAVGDTENERDKEKELANGKIKVDGKWYASIDDYLNDNPIETGLSITPAEITLKKKETEDVEGEEILTKEITATVYGMEKEPEITWETTSNAISLSATTGKSITVSAANVTDTEKNATITAKCTYEGKEYTETSKVILEILKPIVAETGAFVEYNVEYTDVYSENYKYTSTNGWRLLHYDTEDNGKTIYNVELISTGIPAMLCYNCYSEGNWWEKNSTIIKNFITVLNKYGENPYYNTNYEEKDAMGIYAAAGLYYNFERIPFYTSANFKKLGGFSNQSNIGYYSEIKVNGNTAMSNTSGNIFLVSNDYSVRTVTEPELGYIWKKVTWKDTMGLLNLTNLKEIIGYNYDRSSLLDSPYEAMYWLATQRETVTESLQCCSFEYGTSGDNGSIYGVRPVVSLGADNKFRVSGSIDTETGLNYLILTMI